jgi:hypothetical protein
LFAAAVAAAAEPPATKAPADGAALPTSAQAPTQVADARADTAPGAPPPAATTADAPAVSAATPSADPIATTEATPRPAAVAVPQVELRKPTDDTVCHKVRPTGSLISVERCYSRSAVAHSKDSELLHSDLERIREQENDRQARDAAAAMAGRRIEQ